MSFINFKHMIYLIFINTNIVAKANRGNTRKNGFVTATKSGTTNKFFVASTKKIAAATKRFVDRTKHFVVVTKYFCYPCFNK